MHLWDHALGGQGLMLGISLPSLPGLVIWTGSLAPPGDRLLARLAGELAPGPRISGPLCYSDRFVQLRLPFT